MELDGLTLRSLKVSMIKVTEMTPEQGRAYCLAIAYEKCRQDRGQFGYKVFKDRDNIDCDSAIFKTFITVVSWLRSLGWTVGFKEVNWQGFVSFVFDNLPSMPMPGQLKNKQLLREYLTSSGDREVAPVRSPEEMQKIYSRVLRPEILRSTTFQEVIGIKQVEAHAA